MNLSKFMAAGALATSIAFAQEDAWPTDEQTDTATEAVEQSDASASSATEVEDAEQSSAGSASSATEAAEASEPAPAPAANEPAETQTADAEAPRKQSSFNGKAGIGIHGDFNYSTLTGLAQDWNMGDEADAPAGIGFDVGLRGRIPLVDYLQFVPEINFHYAQLVQEDETAERKFTQMDLEIPLMMRATVLDMFYIAAGVQLTLNLSSEVKLEEEDVDMGGGLGTIDFSYEEDIEQAGFGFGIAFGVGFFAMERLSIDAGLVLGLTDIYPNCESVLVDMSGAKQMTFKAGVGFWFM